MELTIEKLIYGGDGLARLSPETANEADERRGKAVFVPFVLPGERVAASVLEEKPGFVRARADGILSASPQRIPSGCPYFARCGGCHYQHTSYEHQLEIKRAILAETVRRGAKLEIDPAQIAVHASPPWNYRNRTRMKLHSEPFALGYHRFGSNELLPVEQCPISSPLINRTITAVWELGRAGEMSDAVAEIEFFANHDDSQLLVELSSARVLGRGAATSLRRSAVRLREALPAVVGVSLFQPTRTGALQRVDFEEEQLGEDHLVYCAAEHLFRVSAGSFFQTNRHMTNELLRLVTAGESGGYALDLYSGVGLFAVPLAHTFNEVAAVESAPFSFHDLRENAPPNMSSFRATTENFLAAQPEANFDLVIVDPPRAGLADRVTRMLADLRAPRLTYVSCDPATLARDLRGLTTSGYRVAEMHLVDLFPQTFHIESVTKLSLQ